VTPIGNSLVDSWNALLRPPSNSSDGSGLTSLTKALEWQNLPEEQLERELQAAQALPCQVAAPVKFSEPALQHDSRTPRFVQMALQSGREALEQAGLLSLLLGDSSDSSNSNVASTSYSTLAAISLSSSDSTTTIINRERIGVCIGSGMSGVREIVEAARTVETRGLRRLSPHFVPKVLSNSAAGRLSLEYSFQGPNHSVSTACAAGTHAIGDALRCIQYDNADIMIAGGAEACIDPLSMAGFSRLKALSTSFNDIPEQASRPFDKDRDGFVMGEGAALLVLEELEHAKRRNAPILAEICGYGLSGDAHHITAPDPDGRGAERAMRMAMGQAADATSMEPRQLETLIGYVNAHATSTPKGDEIEARCIDRIFQRNSSEKTSSDNPPLFVSSTKGATGHLLGAAGAIEAAFTVLSLVHQTIPPTRNLYHIPDSELLPGFQHAMNEPIQVENMQYAINNSFGFGGTNASLVLKQYKED